MATADLAVGAALVPVAAAALREVRHWMLIATRNRPGLVTLTCIFSVELPGIEPGAECTVSCGDTE